MTRQHQRGAALLMAMVIVTLVSTIAASMVWQQYRAVQVEGAERARSQAGWVLNIGLDLARHFLADDARRQPAWDDLTEAWATPLPETRLTAFLSADQNNNAADDNSDNTFIGGAVTDAQSKYNVRNLVLDDGSVVQEQVQVFARLCESIGVSSGLANLIAQKLGQAVTGALAVSDTAAMARVGGSSGLAQAPLMPQQFDDLLWLGLDAGTLERLRPYVTLLPRGNIPINVNTAGKEVLAAVIPKMDLGTAARAVQARQRKPFRTITDLEPVIGKGFDLNAATLSPGSSFFEITGRLRYEDFVIQQRHLVEREGNQIKVRSQSRFSAVDAAN